MQESCLTQGQYTKYTYQTWDFENIEKIGEWEVVVMVVMVVEKQVYDRFHNC